MEKIDEKKENLKRKSRENEKDRKGNLFCYIGETSRSANERGGEHLKDLEYVRT